MNTKESNKWLKSKMVNTESRATRLTEQLKDTLEVRMAEK
jgi:hypothetical protein